MSSSEPTATALFLVAFGTLLVLSVLFSRATDRVSVPVALIFLGIGMLAGSEGIGRIPFDDYRLAFRIGTIALVLILFDGGMNTPLAAIRRVVAPAALLATVGVVATAGIVAVVLHLFGLAWGPALLFGAIVSSTDAAAVFAVLRGSGLQLTRRVGATLELESGVNDPMAIILTSMVTAALVAGTPPSLAGAVTGVALQLAVGAAAGAAVGFGGRWLIARARLPSGGLYAALTLGLACLAFGAPTLMFGSGFLGVYVAAVILGNGPLPFRGGLARVHDALAWLSQITMFLLLGMLVFPSRLPSVAGLGVLVALTLVFVARPAAVALCLAPFRYPRHEVAYVAWVGLRGAVPIILATYPILAGVPGGERIFHVVFFVVVLNALVPGATVPAVTRALGLERAEPPPPPAVLAIESRHPLRGELMSFHIDESLAVTGVAIRDLPLPPGTTIALLVRGRDLVPPRGSTVLQPGDHAYLVVEEADRGMVGLLFGRPEEE